MDCSTIGVIVLNGHPGGSVITEVGHQMGDARFGIVWDGEPGVLNLPLSTFQCSVCCMGLVLPFCSPPSRVS
jgi:hypothetical protein